MKKNPTLQPDTSGDRDRGSILAMTLVMTIVSSLLVMALLTFVATVIRLRPPVEERAVASESARSAIRQAVHQQRVAGPDGCYSNNDVIEINGLDVSVGCAVTGSNYDNVLMKNRFGVITTANGFTDADGNPMSAISGARGAPDAITGERPAIAGAPDKLLSGDVFVNSTSLNVRPSDIDIVGVAAGGGAAGPAGITGTRSGYGQGLELTRYQLLDALLLPVTVDCDAAGATVTDETWDCIDDEWPSRAGYNPENVPSAGTWNYPALPPIPTQGRSSDPVQINVNGSICNVFYPGRYANPIDMTSGDYYFASGIYLFEAPVVARNGATVVGGEGLYNGCVLDSEAALYNVGAQRAPKVHDITGNGTTFLLGGNASVSVERATMLLNRRLSTPVTRASEGVSIRSVNTVAINNAIVSIPADNVEQADGTIVTAASLGYVTSENIDTDFDTAGGDPQTPDWEYPIVRFDTTTGGAVPGPTNFYEFSAGGSIFVPNSGIEMVSDSVRNDFSVEVTGGSTSTYLALDLHSIPNNARDFFFGAKKTAVQSEFRFDALVTSPSGRETVSSSVMQLNVSQEYALNSWTLDIGVVGVDPTNGGAGVGGSGTGGSGSGSGSGSGTSGTSTDGSTTSTSSTTAGTDGGTTDGTTTDGSTTDGSTTAGATTDGGVPDPCATDSNWMAEYFPSSNFTGTPTVVEFPELDFNKDWGTGSPTGIPANNFSARFTRNVSVPADGQYLFTAGSDDGMRLMVNGTVVIDDWTDRSYATSDVIVDLTAACNNEIVMEYFENTGFARATLAFAPFVDPCASDDAWLGQYWDNKTLSGTPDLVRDDANINFNWSNNSAPVGGDYNNFSARWTRNVTVAADADYTFTIGGDDGVRLYVNGSLVIDDWSDHGYRTNQATVQLNAACNNEIVMEFYENSGSARATLNYEEVPEILPCTNPEDPTWSADYYNSHKDFGGYVNDETGIPIAGGGTQLDFDWGNNSWPNYVDHDSKWSVKWDRTVNLDEPGTYRFKIGGNDGVRVYINGDRIISDWSGHSYRETTGEIYISNDDRCGVEIDLEYYQKGGTAAMTFFDWEFLG